MPSEKRPVDEPHPFEKTIPASKKKNPGSKDEDDIPLHIQLLSLNDNSESETAPILLNDIKQNLLLLEKAVAIFEPRYSVRVLRTNATIRRRLTSQQLAVAVTAYFSSEHPSRVLFLSYLKDVPAHNEAAWPASETPKDSPLVIPEGIIYLGLLLTIWLLDNKEYDQGIQLSNELVDMVHTMNRRTLDQLGARVFFYWARLYELKGRLEELRPNLLNALRTATLRRDTESEATLINLLLRNYLHCNLFDQADKLISKTTTPESATNNQAARYMYYLGRIKATQLEYTEAHRNLQQAIRKAPQNTATAGFQQAVYKLSIIVQLLMGEIPDRSVFRLPVLRKSLVPYLHICQAVRVGDLSKFQETLATYGITFRNDKTYTLILRLRHNVIKTGIRMISLSYSRISMHDICQKLGLDSEEDAEFIVSKAIRDGVLDATLDHEKGCMQSKDIADIYSTNEPQNAFHQRIAFCLEHHNESVKAMRFPLDAHRKELDSAKAARQREREIVQEIAEGGDMDEDEDDF